MPGWLRYFSAMSIEQAKSVVGIDFRQWRPFTIHLLTASGAFWAFMAIIAAAERHWVDMFAWLGLALFVDGIDLPNPLATSGRCGLEVAGLRGGVA